MELFQETRKNIYTLIFILVALNTFNKIVLYFIILIYILMPS